MRHNDRIYDLFSSAIRRAVQDNTFDPPLRDVVSPEQRTIESIWRAAERNGAYALIDRMLFRFGRYRLRDCSESELNETLDTINACMLPPSRRLQFTPPLMRSSAKLDREAPDEEAA